MPSWFNCLPPLLQLYLYYAGATLKLISSGTDTGEGNGLALDGEGLVFIGGALANIQASNGGNLYIVALEVVTGQVSRNGLSSLLSQPLLVEAMAVINGFTEHDHEYVVSPALPRTLSDLCRRMMIRNVLGAVAPSGGEKNTSCIDVLQETTP